MLVYIRNTVKETKTLEMQCTGKVMIIHRNAWESIGGAQGAEGDRIRTVDLNHTKRYSMSYGITKNVLKNCGELPL